MDHDAERDEQEERAVREQYRAEQVVENEGQRDNDGSAEIEVTPEEEVKASAGHAVMVAERELAGIDDTAALLAEATDFRITTASEMEASGAILQRIKGRLKDVNSLRKGITGPMDEAKRRVMDAFRPATDRLTAAEHTIKGAIQIWSQEQDRLQRAEQARLDGIAEKERARLAEDAARAEEEGDTETAEVVREEATHVHVEQAPPAATPSGPVHIRETWKAEVTDLRALALAVGEGHHLLEFVQANMQALNAMARTQKGAMNIPGVKAVMEKSVAARA